MTINWLLEVIKPYNETKKTNFKSSVALIAHLRYEQKLTWNAIDKKLGVSIGTLKSRLESSALYQPEHRLREGTLTDKILTIPKKERKEMTIHDFMKRFPGYTIPTFYYILNQQKIVFKRIKK